MTVEKKIENSGTCGKNVRRRKSEKVVKKYSEKQGVC
jgi:hypothetical protein